MFVTSGINLVFYARAVLRFDDIEGGDWQRVFDYGNGPRTNNILLTQVRATSAMRFEFWKDGADYSVEVLDTIVNFEVATYVAQIHADGLMQLFKDDILIGERVVDVLPDNEERANKLVGLSNWEVDTPLIGEVLEIDVDEDGFMN